MIRYFPWEKLLPECLKAELEYTPKAITIPEGNIGSYFSSTRVMSHAYEDW